MPNVINRLLNPFGVAVKKHPNRDLMRRIKLLRNHNIDLILDVGASRGEYGEIMRKNGYKGRIVSFEPISISYEKLKKKTCKDDKWDSFNWAIGNQNIKSEINVSQNFVSSSILAIKDLHTNAEPESNYIRKENIFVKKLDDIFDSVHKYEKGIFIKIDTQGYEKEVINGAKETLKSKVTGLQIELSISPLYEDSYDYLYFISILNQMDFELCSIEPGFYDKKSGKLLQFDGIFFK